VASYEKGDFIRVEFVDEGTGESEWMWVRVNPAIAFIPTIA
jgi:hypothetical protein